VEYLLSFATFAHSLKAETSVGREPETKILKIGRENPVELNEVVTTKKKETSKKGGASSKPHASATAASILGRTEVRVKKNGEVKIKPEWLKFYQRLLELRDQLIRQMNGLAKESAQEMAGYSLHMADSGTDNFDRDFALSLLSSDQDAIYEIEEALKRIEKNTYGICELTGKQIPRTRLEAIPWTRFTVQAQAQLEKEGALRQRRLGALGTVDAVGVAEVETEEEEPEEKAKEKE
jgi:RNA polymerase-binding transcription factor DksA